MRKLMAALFAIGITVSIVSGCGQGIAGLNESQGQPDTSHTEQEQTGNILPAVNTDLPDPNLKPDSDKSNASDKDLPVETQEPDHVEAVIEKNYHMNKVFFIKPNDAEGNKKVVLLTFDDGPKEEELLTSLLDTLDKHQAKAIFFVNGFRVKAKPELLKLIDERGQIIGNHSYDHINLKKESNEKIDQQLNDVQTIVQDTIGKSPQFFRPPHGAGNDYLRAKVKELGMLYMTWSNGSLDWADNQHKPDGVIQSVMDQLAPGSNILMHELPWTAEALDTLLTKIEQAGYTFVDPRAIELEAR